MDASVWFSILGPLDVRVGGRSLVLGGTKPRAILAMLLAQANHVVPIDVFIEELWGDEAPDRAGNTLQVHISNLRKALAPVASALEVTEVIRTRAPGYLIAVEEEHLDLLVFRRAAAVGRRSLEVGDVEAASRALARALEVVVGDPLGDLADAGRVVSVRSLLEQEIARVAEYRFEVEVAAGNPREALPLIEARIADDPYNEHLRALQMKALYRMGRQVDALAAYQDARRVLIEELGVEPAPALRDLEARILGHDPLLLEVPSSGRIRDSKTVVRASVVPPEARIRLLDSGVVVQVTTAVLRIGRHPDCDVSFDDSEVSRFHAEVRFGVSGFTLVDCGSTNGTFVNSERVAERVLRSGDEVRVAGHRIRFESGEKSWDS